MARSRSLKCTRASVGAQLEIELSSTREVAPCLYNVPGDCNAETIRSEAGSLVRVREIKPSAKAARST